MSYYHEIHSDVIAIPLVTLAPQSKTDVRYSTFGRSLPDVKRDVPSISTRQIAAGFVLAR